MTDLERPPEPDHGPDLEQLRALPVHANAANPAPAARAAFDRAFGRTPAEGALALVSRGLVPVGLVGIVGAYLLWAFSAAIALYH